MLAAGGSRRFGADKRQAQLASGNTLIRQSIDNTLQAFTEVLVVLRYDDRAFEQTLQRSINNPRLRTFRAPESALGMGRSLANAVGQLADDVDAAFIFLADMPHIQPATLEQLQLAFTENQAQTPIVLPVHAGRYGHPAGFDKAYFPEMTHLKGDHGARPIIDSHQARVIEVLVQDPGVLQDIDTPEDLATNQTPPLKRGGGA